MPAFAGVFSFELWFFWPHPVVRLKRGAVMSSSSGKSSSKSSRRSSSKRSSTKRASTKRRSSPTVVTPELLAELDVLHGFTNPAELASPFGPVNATGVIRGEPGDFQVNELPLELPCGEGEHAWLRIRKIGNNTAWVAKQLATFACVELRDVSYAGLKDRDAVTEQWFSVWLPGRADPDWSLWSAGGVEVLEVIRHRKKLRRGDLRGNEFRLRVRELSGDIAALEAQLAQLAKTGVPNYFGYQRFGRDGGNLRLLLGKRPPDRDQRSMGYSALRSSLFNGYLNQRVIGSFWDNCDGDSREGDVPLSDRDGDLPAYTAFCGDAALGRPTAALFGEGRGRLSPPETAFFADFPAVTALLIEEGLKLHRRSIWLPVVSLKYSFTEDSMELTFSLPPGAFATTVLDMIVDYRLGNAPVIQDDS